MSAQRFIRCKHCGMPHEAATIRCPITGQELVPEKRKTSSSPTRAAGGADEYKWAHSVRPQPAPQDEARERDASTLIGRTIEDKYRIDRLIGRGGMGAVYRAENTRIGKYVAIKILLKGYAKGSEGERRFLREARIAGSIGHPNICEVFDLGTLEDGAPYQVMELLEGGSLASRIKLEGALPIDEVLDISEQVLSALAAAHGRGIVHRDLKPDNVFLHTPSSGRHRGHGAEAAGGATQAKLLDFGVSKSLLGENTLSLTQTGVIVGTPYYLAPEQARGDRGLDHRVDLWAMGVVMYEALTGALPFKADNYNALIVKILQTRPPLPTALRPRLHEPIEAIVMRALAHEPRDRFGSAEEMLAALRLARRLGSGADAAALHGQPEVLSPSVAASPSEGALEHDLRISVVHGPEDPTEIRDSFGSREVDESSGTGPEG